MATVDSDTESTAPDESPEFRAGQVALLGRPNVGKSTLLNALIGSKVSIVTRKPQTTRHRIAGVHTLEGGQIVYLDTPGIHVDTPRAINRYMNRAAAAVLDQVDAVVLVVEALQWREADERVLDHLRERNQPIVVAINKVDQVSPKERLLPYLDELSGRGDFAEIVPVSARKREGLDGLETAVLRLLPKGPPTHADDDLTDRSVRFLAAEIIREKVLQRVHREVPYSATVEIEAFKESQRLVRISALIWVEREGQKAIMVGRGGSVLKDIGQRARLDIERLLERKVHLQLWVKVRANWADDEAALRRFGYEE